MPNKRGVVFSPPYRDIVQLAERLSGGQEAAGSSPAISTKSHGVRRTPHRSKQVGRLGFNSLVTLT